MRFEQYILSEAKTAKTAEHFEWMVAQLLYFCTHTYKDNSVKEVFEKASEVLSNNERDENNFYKGTFVSKYKNDTINAVEHLLKWRTPFKQICNLGNTVRCMCGNTSSPGGSPKADLIIDGRGISVKLGGDIVAASAQGKKNFRQIFQDGLEWFIRAEGREPKGKTGKDIVKEYKEAVKFISKELIGEVKERFVDLTDNKNYKKMFGDAVRNADDPEKIEELIDEIVEVQKEEIEKLNGKLDEHSEFMQSEIRKKSVETLNGIFDGPDGKRFKMYIVAEQLTGWNKYKRGIGCATHILSPHGFYEMIDSSGRPNESLLNNIASRTTFNFRGLPKDRGGKIHQLEAIYRMSARDRINAMKSFFNMAHGMKADVKKARKSKNEGVLDVSRNIIIKLKNIATTIFNQFKNFVSSFLSSLNDIEKKENEFIDKEVTTVQDIMNLT
jgi:hypothetical protein